MAEKHFFINKDFIWGGQVMKAKVSGASKYVIWALFIICLLLKNSFSANICHTEPKGIYLVKQQMLFKKNCDDKIFFFG